MKSYHEIICVNPEVRSGQACIRNLRITVADVMSYLASGMSIEEVLNDFPKLTKEDILACFAYIADSEKHVKFVSTE
jgi:uncharacterized protein (DUF433 family)